MIQLHFVEIRKKSAMQKLTIRGSRDFWALLGVTFEHKRRRARALLMQWDRRLRPFPQHWRQEQQEVTLTIDDELQQLLQQLRQAKVPIKTALMSAAVQEGLGQRGVEHAPDAPQAACAKPANGKDAAQSALARGDGERGAQTQASAPADIDLFRTPYTPEQAAILLGKLRALRNEAIAQLRALHRYAFEADEASRGGDEADAGNEYVLRAGEDLALRRAQRLLVEADAALKRFRQGSYGWCEETGEPIEYRRMLANPLARLSLEVQNRAEARSRLQAV